LIAENKIIMRMVRRFLYLIYYLKHSELKTVKPFVDYASEITGYSNMRLIFEAIRSVFRYNTSIKDYFYFRFFELTAVERKKWAGTGFMYEYQLLMNPKGARDILEDKILFLQRYKPFINRRFYSVSSIKSEDNDLEKMLSNDSGKIVLKSSHGQVGAEVEVISTEKFNLKDLTEYMRVNNYDLAEEYVVQHHSLMELSPSGLNTIRVFTQLNGVEVDFLGARLRISVNSPVDNMGAGNLAAPVNIETGEVNGSAVYSDITKHDEDIHPITGKEIVGFEIPFWKETVEMVRKAALYIPENRSIGWDVAITETGPQLIEGNHNWCKLLWQLPVKQGLKNELEKYL